MPSPTREGAVSHPNLAPPAHVSQHVLAAVARIAGKRPLGVIGGAILLVPVAMTSLAPIIAAFDPYAVQCCRRMPARACSMKRPASASGWEPIN